MEYFSVVKYKDGDILLREGAVSSCLYYIEEGSVICYLNYGEPNEFLVGILSSGRFFGEVGILVGERSPYTIVANDEVALHIVEKDNLLHYLSKNPQTGIKLMKDMARENSALSKHISQISEEFIETIELMEKNKPVPIDLKKKLMQYRIGAYTS